MHTKKVKVSDLALGPVRHKTLPLDLVERIKTCKKILADVDPASLEETIDTFRRDVHPDREVSVWERIAHTYHAFTTLHGITDYPTRAQVFAALLVISCGGEDFRNVSTTLTQDQLTELKYNF